MYKILVRPILFLFSPEIIHHLVFIGFRIGAIIPGLSKLINNYKPKTDTSVNFLGLKLKSPVGLAAGLDKEAEAIDMLGYLGFGFVEIGTVTPKPQPGNPKPRMFRLKKNSALINRMGFNNSGVFNIIKNLKSRKTDVIVGGNIGKNKITPNAEAVNDYLIGFEELYPYVDYFVVNVSSPNTPNLRQLQDKEPLTELLQKLMDLNNSKPSVKPLLLKIAPDLTNEQIDDIIDIVSETKISGLVATNTTISREGLDYSEEHIAKIGAGGLSGAPLKKRSTDIIRYISEKTNNQIPIIGSGGIMTVEDAMEKIDAGARVVQLFTGFIYEGPSLIKKINNEFVKRR